MMCKLKGMIDKGGYYDVERKGGWKRVALSDAK